MYLLLQHGTALDLTRYFEPTVLWYPSLCLRFISFAGASPQLPLIYPVCNAPGNNSTLENVTSSWARSRHSNDSIELIILQNLKAVVSFNSVTPWQSAINSISFLSDILNLPYNLAKWRQVPPSSNCLRVPHGWFRRLSVNLLCYF